ncbi:hypothetical protein [Dongia deserti]|uniref:hypothetical protein n=1 Tax=Dongia deserti TaxID=2268030 RepID=UPI000E651762|nr:hypothetical protein [Dongia deserti]
MSSISYRTSLGREVLNRAKSGLAALPAGIARGVMRSCRGWIEVGRDLHQYGKSVVHDVGFQVRTGMRSGSPDPERSAANVPPQRGRASILAPRNQPQAQKED